MATQAINYTNSISEFAAEGADLERYKQPINELIGGSSWAQDARKLIAAYAANQTPVILEGERGTGKRFVAGLIHRSSRFGEGPFISLALGDSGDVARTVLLDLMRWLETNAGMKDLKRGTLYLEVPPDWFDYQTNAIPRNDGTLQFRIVIGCTIQGGTHRRRPAGTGLHCQRIQIPPLRYRADDIEPLVTHFIKQCCRQMRKEFRDITSDAMRELCAYDWPRNISELKTLVYRLLNQPRLPSIGVSLLPTYICRSKEETLLPASGLDLASEVERFEIALIRTALRQSRGRQNRAAQLLRIKPTTLYMKLKRHSIEVEDFKPHYVNQLSDGDQKKKKSA